MDDDSWWGYVQRTAQTSRQRDIAERTWIDESNISRWKRGHVPKPDAVAAFARAYERPVLEAFVAAGFLTADEAGQVLEAPPDLTAFRDEEIADEVRRRFVAYARASEDPYREDRNAHVHGVGEVRVAARRTGAEPDTAPTRRAQDEIESGSQDPGGMDPA